MPVPVVIMAGGKSSRFGRGEKMMAVLGGKPLLHHLLEALKLAGALSPTVITSPWTPETERFVRSLGLEVIQSPGQGYVEDVRWLSKKVPRFLCLAGDIPFPPAPELARFLQTAEGGHSSIVGVLPDRIRLLGPTPGPEWPHPISPYGLCRVVGINIVDSRDPGDHEVFVFQDPWIGVALTSPTDLGWIRRNAP
ncbi:MAG: NTP transferase domain-containing protein [Nitrososphaerota archaeon]|nr:NTP transferase domain-containing protein [Nitrososphaerota archaeon]